VRLLCPRPDLLPHPAEKPRRGTRLLKHHKKARNGVSNTPASSILIVDDNASLRMVLAIIFSREGYQVRLAEDGFSALDEIERHTPDLLLSDLNMPGMSGFELLSVVRQRFPMIRVVAMSAAFFGEQLPAGVMADAFYAKGTHSIEPLLKLVSLLAGADQPNGRQPAIYLPPTPRELALSNAASCIAAVSLSV
jgi:CheY-like chemotaxis protein